MRWLAATLLVLSFVNVAQAQAPTLVLVPESTPPRVRDAIRVELQLSGRRVAFMTVDGQGEGSLRELAAHAQGEVIALEPQPGGMDIVRIGPGRTLREHVVPGTWRSPRAVALLALALLEVEPPAVRREPMLEVPVPVLELPAPVLVAAREPRPMRAPEPMSPPVLAATGVLASPEIVLERAPAPLPPVLERVGLEALGALLLGGSLAFGGALFADSVRGADDPFPWWAVGLTIGGTIGTSAGALIAGRLTGANGDPFWTLSSGVAGGAVAGLLLWVGLLTDSDPVDGVTSGWTYIGAALAGILPPALAIVAFELSVPTDQTPRLTIDVTPNGVRGTF